MRFTISLLGDAKERLTPELGGIIAAQCSSLLT